MDSSGGRSGPDDNVDGTVAQARDGRSNLAVLDEATTHQRHAHRETGEAVARQGREVLRGEQGRRHQYGGLLRYPDFRP
jgi:hypothetical protein